jgi:hypothetical protein
MRSNAKLNIRSIPASCFTHDKLNYEKRLLKSEFVQVCWIETKVFYLFLNLILIFLLKCLLNVSENMSSEIFDFFTNFVHDCANHFIYLANKNSASKIFYKLFEILDQAKVNNFFFLGGGGSCILTGNIYLEWLIVT